MDPDIEQLITTHLPLAQSLAQQVWRTAPHALELDELRAIAQLGLVGAARRWQPYCEANGYSPEALQFFRPFVSRRVYGALIDGIRKSDYANRQLRERARALAEAGQGQGVSDAQLAARTGLSVADVRATMRGMARRPVSLEGEQIELACGTDVESTVFTHSILARMVEAVRALPREQQTIIALHYHGGLQLQDVAAAMGVAESRVSGLHAEAVLAIHHAMRVAVGDPRSHR